jgi:biopolymer transport protein ExbB
MFLNADIVVKGVLVGLAFASLVTWTVWLAKTIELRLASSRARRRIGMLEQGGDLRDAVDACDGDRDAIAQLILSTAREAELSGGVVDDGFKERVALRLERVEAAATRLISRGVGILATIGATAPFVGLFGTVWGIMNSFIGISESHTTNLAVVAPGIAEALLATALGLVAAIPAVVIYNHLARVIAGYRLVGRRLGTVAAHDQPGPARPDHVAAARGGVTAVAMRLGSRSGSDDLEIQHEINVTPFIDVILVLLIIFMVAAPLATVDIGVNLPASTAPEQPRPDKPVFVTIKSDQSVAIGDTIVAREALPGTLDTATNSRRDETIFIRADKALSYGELMAVMNIMRDAGYLKLALVGLETPATKP